MNTISGVSSNQWSQGLIQTRFLFALFLICTLGTSALAESSTFWFHERVTCQAGNEPRPWETTVVSPMESSAIGWSSGGV
ncbi:MAG TPA: hypothetical protein VHA33_29080 [Candidatus Angelobacter sp.]|nr:hypothetical protein [Candidatus Angelobacter sp.]